MGGRGGSGRSIAGQGPPVAASSDIIFDIVERTIKTDPSGANLTTVERLRKALSGLTREEQDAELVRLARARKILLVPASNQKTMTKEERAAEVFFGNERKAHVALSNPF